MIRTYQKVVLGPRLSTHSLNEQLFNRFPASSSDSNYLIRCAVNIGFFAFESVGITGGSQVQAEREWFEFSKWTTR